MAQATFDNNTRRRDFLTLTAAVATVALGARPSLASPPFYGAECPSYPACKGGCGLGCTKEIERVRDPIYAAIDAHQEATAALNVEVGRHSDFERELHANNRLQRGLWLEDERRQNAEIEAALDKAHDAETDAACALLSERPTTMAGVVALLRYADAFDTDGEGWPPELQSDDGSKTRSWHHFLIANLAEILPGLMAGDA